MVQTSVQGYFADGCGRCDNFATPACKVHLWTAPLGALRELLQEAGLEELMRWGSPCYAVDGGNVLMLTSFKEFCALSFFKGTLLPDPEGLLESPGPNSQAMRLLKFTSLAQVEERREATRALIRAAIEVERSGAKVVFTPGREPVPEELAARLEADPALRAAFDALTPGRQRSHVLFVGGAKQSATRASRVDKCVPKILAGKGFQDR